MFKVFILRVTKVREREVCKRTTKAVPSSPNLRPAFAASWNGIPLKENEARSNDALFNLLPGPHMSD
jgi:hypothetical protein